LKPENIMAARDGHVMRISAKGIAHSDLMSIKTEARSRWWFVGIISFP
jgi:hypothetical protein